MGKAFPYEDELKTKTARLVELGSELNMDGRGRSQPEEVIAKSARPSIMEQLKRSVPARNTDHKPKHPEKEHSCNS